VSVDDTITVLDEDTINRIAAGEVVERPASVVKEFMENAIDAGASEIIVETQGPPGTFIKVSDNGRGMSPSDLPLAFMRHATSKIKTADDLLTVLSMGFRGEALPSIVAVSRIEVITRRNEDRIGTRVVYEGGAVVSREDHPSQVGLTIVCRDLFYNTPARRKFQKSPSTEAGHIRDTVARLSLAQPNVRFRLICDGKVAFVSQGQGDKRNTIASVYGAEIVKGLLPIAAGSRDTRIEGFITPPDVSRTRRDMQHVFINGRPCVVPVLTRTIENVYGRRLPVRRYPAIFLWISANPVSVDVNVHPAKREVRFSKNHDVFRLVAQATSSALRSVGAAPNVGWGIHEGVRGSEDATQDGTILSDDRLGGIHRLGVDLSDLDPPDPGIVQDLHARYSTAWQSEDAGGRFKPIGIFKDTYILAEDGEDLVIIDQHAAHERIIYEEVLKGLAEGVNINTQTLIPQSLDFAPGVVEEVKPYLSELAGIGIILEEFGDSSVLLRGIPSALTVIRGTDPIGAVTSAIELFADEVSSGIDGVKATDGIEGLLGRVAAELACKAVVKARDRLEPREVEKLLSDLRKAEDPYSCPHGRPTLLRISWDELERTFRRK
jgi:DNA mismatch repair protein MutL